LGSVFSGRKARGTFAAPSAVLNGDTLATYRGFGYGTTNYGSGGAGMLVRTTQDWTDTANGTQVRFFVTANNSTTSAEVAVITSSGGFCLGCGNNTPSNGIDIVRNGTAQYTASAYGVQPGLQPTFLGRAGRGIAAAPTATLNNDALAAFVGAGYGATTGVSGHRAGMTIHAQEDWTDTAQGAQIIFRTTPTGSTTLTDAMRIGGAGNVVIGGSGAAFDRLHVLGDVRVGTTGTNGCLKDFSGAGIIGTCASDLRYKKNITSFPNVLGSLTSLRPVHYFWRAEEFPDQGFGDRRASGLIAQEVEAVLPELVVTGADGFKAVDYGKLPLLTIQAIKELKAENDALAARNAALETRLAELERTGSDIDRVRERLSEVERLLGELLAASRQR
jgi:hypothetical protein